MNALLAFLSFAEADPLEKMLARTLLFRLILRAETAGDLRDWLTMQQFAVVFLGMNDRAAESMRRFILEPPSHLPPIIFTRSRNGETETHAVERVLLIPPTEEELRLHLQQLFPSHFSSNLLCGVGGAFRPVEPDAILAVLADGDRSIVVAKGKQNPDRRPLRTWCQLLDNEGVIQVDRSTLLRTSAITGIIPWGRGAKIQLGSASIEVGRTGYTNLRKTLAARPDHASSLPARFAACDSSEIVQ